MNTITNNSYGMIRNITYRPLLRFLEHSEDKLSIQGKLRYIPLYSYRVSSIDNSLW